MKKLTFFLVLAFGFINSQSYKRLYDPSIVAQEKRQVFEKWGDWRPYPKYYLGIQTNFSYATVWGWLSPSINRDYKNGSDIRPLKANGLEVQRQVLNKTEENQTIQVGKSVDSLYQRNIADFAYWTSLTSDADPLWLLYFKSRLKPLIVFPEHPSSYDDWKLPSEEVYINLQRNGYLAQLQEDLDILKSNINIARKVDMPRGKRFLLYVETLKGWRKLMEKLKIYQEKTTFVLKYKKYLDKLKTKVVPIRKSDREIAQQVMEHYQHYY